ncbi:YdcH family protein [Stutzerimonas kunmingensis]|uniref:YdcH family protein n=1 Tax=Stutzerimonas kunmingensis TaxID=1211807 RepID=UPI00241D44D2|nr:YdcH family protein [Stutzerimonas kunmingensis]
MFPEYRDLITRLKAENKTFARLFDEHNELDQRIKNIEAHIVLGTDSEVETLKKEKLQLKDRLYAMLKEAPAA